MYWYSAELVIKSYMPKALEKGMLFVIVNETGTILWELDHIPQDFERFIVKNGAPIEVLVMDVDNNDVLAQYNEIGWIDDGDDVDELREITLEDINIIVNDYQGELEIEVIEEFYDEDEQIIPNMYNQKVILRLLCEDEDDEETEENYET